MNVTTRPRGRVIVGAVATMAVILGGFSLSVAGATVASGANHTGVRPAKDDGYWTSSNKGTWSYNSSCQCWEYDDMKAVWDSGSSEIASGTGTLHLSGAVSVAAGEPVTAVSLDILGKQTSLKAANLYTLVAGGKTATLDQSLPAPSGADQVTISATGGATSGIQTITFGNDGAAKGKVYDVPIDAFVDVVMRRPLTNCANGHADPPVVEIPTVADSGSAPGTATGLPVAGFPILMPCHDTFPNTITVK